MSFKKLFFNLLLVFFIFVVTFFNFNFMYNFSFDFFNMDLDIFKNFNLAFLIDDISLVFIFMVCLVTCLVCLYSEIYMEHYNNKKFFSLMFLFFMFMSILSVSGSFILFFLGWDGLGISSICLIMFYPNKNTSFNSILTMVFNRMGDVSLIIVLCFFIQNFSTNLMINSKYSPLIIFLIMLCSFTKSAQFPLSSWLPAAMSAPTPISAMVHSSTLVTAGILLTQMFFFYYLMIGLNHFLFMISILSFLMGGLMAVMELDFKKIIAFSTMSQISMIMVFCSVNFLVLALSHMVFHAFFKTSLFMSAGFLFMFFYSKQQKNFMVSSNKMLLFFSCIMFFSVYSMSGFSFSSSFFSKDLMLEYLSSLDHYFYFFSIIFGSILTLVYSSKLLSSTKSNLNLNKSLILKSNYFNFSMFFMIFVLYSGHLFSSTFMAENFPILFRLDLIFMNFVIISSIFLIIKNNFFTNFNNTILNSTLEIFFMKFFSYSIFFKLTENKNFNFISFSDSMMFKSYYLKLVKANFDKLIFESNSYLISFLFSIILMWIMF